MKRNTSILQEGGKSELEVWKQWELDDFYSSKQLIEPHSLRYSTYLLPRCDNEQKNSPQLKHQIAH